MGRWNGYTDILKGLLTVHDAIRDDFSGISDKLRKYPQFRMFLDSKLGSPIEDATKKLWSDAVINAIRSKLPKGKLSSKVAKGLGSWIGEKANSFMDRVKLLDHYRKGRISVDEYVDRRSTQIQATLVNVVKSAKKFAWIGRQAIYHGLEVLGIPQPDNILGAIASATGVRWAVKKATQTVEKAVKSEKTKRLIEKGIVAVHAGITAVKKSYDYAKEAFIDPVIKKTANFVEKSVERVIDFGKKTTNAVKSGVKKAWSWIKNRF